MTTVSSSPPTGQNGSPVYTSTRRIIQAVENLIGTCIDHDIPEQKQRERIKGRASDIRRSINKLREAACERPPKFSPTLFKQSELPTLLEKLDERISEEPLLQEAHTMFDALSKLSHLIEDEPRALSYDIQRILAWSKFHERLGDKIKHPDVPSIEKLSEDLDEIVRRAHDPNSPITLQPCDVDRYVAAHTALAYLAGHKLER